MKNISLICETKLRNKNTVPVSSANSARLVIMGHIHSGGDRTMGVSGASA